MEAGLLDEAVVVEEPQFGVVVVLTADEEGHGHSPPYGIGDPLPCDHGGGQERYLAGGVQGYGAGIRLGHVVESLGREFDEGLVVVLVAVYLVDVLEYLVEDAFPAVACAHRSQDAGVLGDVLGTAQHVVLQSFGCLFHPSHSEMLLLLGHVASIVDSDINSLDYMHS